MTMLEDELARIENTFKDVGACAEAAFDDRIRTLLGVTKALREVELISAGPLSRASFFCDR
jgi:hypothetical protein